MSEEETPPGPDLPVRDGSRFVAVIIALFIVVAVGMIALRLQAPGNTGMGADVSDDMPADSH